MNTITYELIFPQIATRQHKLSKQSPVHASLNAPGSGHTATSQGGSKSRSNEGQKSATLHAFPLHNGSDVWYVHLSQMSFFMKGVEKKHVIRTLCAAGFFSGGTEM